MFSMRYRGALVWLMLLAGCVEPYAPQVISAPPSYLVVDGFINPVGTSSIRLSRTVALGSSASIPPETRAQVYIEEENGPRYTLTEGTAGTYASTALRLTPGRRVRLYLTTGAQQTYASDFTVSKITPPLDSVSWRAKPEGVQIYVNTHDDAQQARYYRWSYEETWQFTSGYASTVEFKNRQFLSRKDDIYHCWGSERPSAINLANTAALTRDVVARQRLVLLANNSKKLRFRYSILVKQYALTQAEYNYLDLLRKNTESLGTLFDPQPSQLAGNVHCLSDDRQVALGFVGVQSVVEQRIFIDRRELPRDWSFATGYETCFQDTIPRPHAPPPPPYPLKVEEVLDFFETGVPFPIEVLQFEKDPTDPKPEPPRPYIVYSSAECVDCRLRGTNVKPDFWQ